MSLNTAHINGGVLIYSGEQILLFSENVTMEWSGQNHKAFNGSKHGKVYLTSHRLIFNNSNFRDEMQSFSFPFMTMSELEVEQPIFGANYIKAKVRAQPNGNWMGQAKFKLTFKHGGAIEFGHAMLKAGHLATRDGYREAPPAYFPPQTQNHAVLPPDYAPASQGYYGWAPPTNIFPNQPPQDGVFMTDAPPPYPGINSGYEQPDGYPQLGGSPPQYAPQNGEYLQLSLAL